MALNATLALAVAAEEGVTPDLARQALSLAKPAKGRMVRTMLGGVTLLDDTYNANADSMVSALQTLSDLPCAGRRVAVLGDMAELGCLAETAHVEVGIATKDARVDRLVAVGSMASVTATAARKSGVPAVDALSNADDVVSLLKDWLKDGDIVLVKASRSARLERVVEGLRAQWLGAVPKNNS